MQGLSGPAIDMKDPIIGLLFSLVAASAHIIVPAAIFNLKVLSARTVSRSGICKGHQQLA